MNTKRIFADSLEVLLQDRPLGNITVQDITAQSGLSRSTFYKHFNDKYDLVGWMFPSDKLVELASSIDSTSYETTLADVVSLIEEWRIVYANAVNDPYEELVYTKILEHTFDFYRTAFAFDIETDEDRIKSTIRQLAIKQITDFLLNWVIGKISLTKEEVLEVLTKLWPEDIFR